MHGLCWVRETSIVFHKVSAVDPMLSNQGLEAGVTRTKVAAADRAFELSIRHVVPAAREIAKCALHLREEHRGGFGGGLADKSVADTLTEAWSSMHELCTPAAARVVPPLSRGKQSLSRV